MNNSGKPRPGKKRYGMGGGSYRGHQIGRSDFLSNNGTYNMICDRCGFKVKSNHMKKEWTGLMVCDHTVNDCWEERQPQDFVRGIPDRQSVNPARPDKFIFEIYTPANCNEALCGGSWCGNFYLR